MPWEYGNKPQAFLKKSPADRAPFFATGSTSQEPKPKWGPFSICYPLGEVLLQEIRQRP